MTDKRIKTYTYFRKRLNTCAITQIENVLLELTQKFPAFYDFLIDIYVIIKEKRIGTHQQKKKEYKYTTELSKQNYKIKSQQDIANKLQLQQDTYSQL